MTTTIRYQVNELPEYEGWEYRPAPGCFLFHFKAVVEDYRKIVLARLPNIHWGSRSQGYHHDYVGNVRALAWLEETWLKEYPKPSGSVIPWPNDLQDLMCWCKSLIYDGEYASVHCPACFCDYAPEDIEVLE